MIAKSPRPNTRFPEELQLPYTWGIKHRGGDTIMVFNMTRVEAEQVAFHDPQFIAVPVSKDKYKPRNVYIHIGGRRRP